MCRVLSVSASGYYRWIKNPISKRKEEELLLKSHKLKDIEEVEQALFWYIEVYYNRRRKHSANGLIAPIRYEELFWEKQKQA